MISTSLLRIFLTGSFRPFVFGNIPTKSLDYQNEKQLGLYIHIPFCLSLCSFCPYCKVIYNKNTAIEYKEALLREIDLVGSELTEKKEVTSLYFGGGTPSLMIDDLFDIVTVLQKYFRIKNGIGIELHPNDVSDKNLTLLKNAGVNMISIGVQSFDRNCLSLIGRAYDDFSKKIRIAEQYEFDVIDVDLIFALPGQTEEILLSDIETAFSSGATQISTYPFIDFTFSNNKYKPLSEKYKKRLLEVINRYCIATDKERTSVWTFTLKNTQQYSSVTRDNFLGFGVSATTLLHKQFKINTFSIKAYIERIKMNRLPTSLTLHFSFRQRIVYYLFWRFYGTKINKIQFRNFFGIDLYKIYPFELFLGKIVGLIKEDETNYFLTEKGIYYYHLIEQKYTNAYIDKMWNISRNVDFPEKIVLR
ncbi:MAG: radical SAM protein [Planctomycetaceae bacterium]|jgi:oxygen-independent coproporphyrinogen-3 oxidase|nr:radical SAM protein [Planctomycetaceae bacterium]